MFSQTINPWCVVSNNDIFSQLFSLFPFVCRNDRAILWNSIFCFKTQSGKYERRMVEYELNGLAVASIVKWMLFIRNILIRFVPTLVLVVPNERTNERTTESLPKSTQIRLRMAYGGMRHERYTWSAYAIDMDGVRFQEKDNLNVQVNECMPITNEIKFHWLGLSQKRRHTHTAAQRNENKQNDEDWHGRKLERESKKTE